MIWLIVVFGIGLMVGRWWAGRQADPALATTTAIANEQARVLARAHRLNHQTWIARNLMEEARRNGGEGRE